MGIKGYVYMGVAVGTTVMTIGQTFATTPVDPADIANAVLDKGLGSVDKLLTGPGGAILGFIVAVGLIGL